MVFCRLGVMAEGLDVEADGEPLLGTGEIDEGRAEDELEHGVGVIEHSGAASKAVEELFMAVARSEEGAIAREEVDVAGEGEGGLVG